MDKEELRAKAHILNPAMWILDNEFVNENQAPFEFDLHRFMLQPYSDSSPDQVIMKSAQVGWSVAAILKAIHACYLLKLNVIYVLPTRNASSEFVVPKVNPMLQRNPKLAELVKNTDNKSLKQIMDRWLYFRGSHHMGEAVSTTADVIIADEFDLCNQLVLSMMQSRMQASKHRWYWKFSNPSLPGFGVHERFQQSDQMHWFITCHHCEHESYIDFEQGRFEAKPNHYVNQKLVIFACGKCGKELSDNDRQGGRWQAKFPERESRGYWINQLMVPWVDAKLILKQQEDMDTQSFHNMVLGLPYQASEYLINRESILRACVPGEASKSDVVMGVDVGKEKHWVMGNPEGIFTYGKTNDWEDIERLFTMYNATTVIDAGPEFTIPHRFTQKYPGKVFINYYIHDSKSIDPIIRKEGTEAGVINSDRTKLFDMLAAEITSGSLRFFQPPTALEELIYHFEQMYRVVENDTRGIPHAKWETKDNRPDHFAHATAYYRVALSLMLRSGEVGGVRLAPPKTDKHSFFVQPDDTVKVKDVFDIDKIVEKNFARNRKKRIV